MVAFSNIVHWMHFAIVIAMGGRVQRATHAILSEYTVAPLVGAWRSVLIETCGQEVGSGPDYHKELDPEDHRVLSELCKEILEINEIRTDFAHGAWLVGYSDGTDDWTKAMLDRTKNAKEGVTFQAGKLAPMLQGRPAAVVLDELSVRAEICAQAVSMFSTTLQMNTALMEKPAATPWVKIKKGKDQRRIVYISPYDVGATWYGSDGSIGPLPVS